MSAAELTSEGRAHAYALGCEGIVSKRLGSPYRSGRVDHWLKIKNPAAPAVRRERRRIGAAMERGEGEHMAVVCPLKTVAEIASAIFGLAAARLLVLRVVDWPRQLYCNTYRSPR